MAAGTTVKMITQRSELSYAPDQSTQQAIEDDINAQLTAILAGFTSPVVVGFYVDRSKASGVRLYFVIQHS